MSKLWKLKWFKPIALAVMAIAVIVVIVVSSPPENQDLADTATDNVILKPETTPMATMEDNEELAAKLDEQEVVAADFIETEFIKDVKDFDSVTDLDYVELDESKNGAAARWVDGKAVPMSSAEIAAFEEQLYACQTVEEYEALLETIAYYNKGIDMSKFPWYWDELSELYSDEQIDMMQRPDAEKRVPNVVGMSWMEAYNKMTEAGFIVRMYYHYDPNSNQPLHHCTWQEAPAGQKWSINSNFFLHFQGPEILQGWHVRRLPGETDFDFYQELISQHDLAIIPDVFGMTESEALKVLADNGFNNVYVYYSNYITDFKVGTCFKQGGTPGELGDTRDYFIRIQLFPEGMIIVPNVIGLTEEQATQILTDKGFAVQYYYLERSSEMGIVVNQFPEADCYTNESDIVVLYIPKQAEPQPTETPDPAETPIPETTTAPTETPDPTEQPGGE